jgi:hypothetical protein
MRPRLWPYAAAFALLAIIWTVHVMARYFRYWEATGQEMPHMGSSIRNGVLVVLVLVALVYGASAAWLHRSNVSAGASINQQQIKKVWRMCRTLRSVSTAGRFQQRANVV